MFMKRRSFAVFFTLFSTVALAANCCFAAASADTSSSAETGPKRSSEIPLRRDFPLDKSVSPCTDFHKYVCSIAESRFQLRPDRSSHDFAFADSSERILNARKSFMKNLPHEKHLSTRAKQFQDFYMSCMDTSARAKEEKEKVADLKKRLATVKTPAEFIHFINEDALQGRGGLIGFNDRPDLDQPDILDIYLGSSLMFLPDHSYYDNKDLLADYEKIITSFFETTEPGIKKEEAMKKAAAIIALQKDFIKTYPQAAARRQRFSENRTATQADILKTYPELQLNMFFDLAPKKALVNIPIPEGLAYLNSHATAENLNLLKDLYYYRMTSPVMDEGYPAYHKKIFEFNHKYFGGPEVRPDLQERCTRIVSDYFNMEMDQVLTQRLFPHFDDKKVTTLVETIRSSILNGLEGNTWLSPEAKKAALLKVKVARLQLVQPHTDREWDFIPIRKYSRTAYLKNDETYSKAALAKVVAELPKPTNHDAWAMGPLTVNAYYSATDNKFVLPIGIMQYPFYDKDGDLIENLGAVGAVTGHELGHSIDDQGSKYDEKGRLHAWMSMKDLAEFNKRGRKMIDQFNKIGHNGSLTQGENIADLVGLTFAYRAAFPNDKGAAKDKQRFFESYARVWCNVERPEFAAMLRKTDPHADPEARINQQVKHQSGFAEAFSCKPGDPMVLSDDQKVKIW
jgi:putative endopeptidase